MLARNSSLPVNAVLHALINASNKPVEITLLNEHLPMLTREKRCITLLCLTAL